MLWAEGLGQLHKPLSRYSAKDDTATLSKSAGRQDGVGKFVLARGTISKRFPERHLLTPPTQTFVKYYPAL